MSEYRGINLIQLPDKKSWSPRGGWIIGRPFQGSEAQITQAMFSAQAAGDAFDMNPGVDGSPWEITIFFGAEETQSPTEPLSDEWDLDGNTLEKELWELPFVRSGFIEIYNLTAAAVDEGVAVDAMNWIRKNLEAYINGNATKTKDLGGEEFDLTFNNLAARMATIPGVSVDQAKAFILRIARLFARGVKAFPVSQFVLRRTRVLANNFSKAALDGIYEDVFKRRSTDSLKSKENIPDDIKFELPAGEWVKHTPDLMRSSSLKRTLKEEWWHADTWDEEIYGELL